MPEVKFKDHAGVLIGYCRFANGKGYARVE
jgi:hypothetical protein